MIYIYLIGSLLFQEPKTPQKQTIKQDSCMIKLARENKVLSDLIVKKKQKHKSKKHKIIINPNLTENEKSTIIIRPDRSH